MHLSHRAPIAVAALTLALGATACGHVGSSKTPDPGAMAAFTAYAEGGRPEVPWADIVTYRIAGERVARFDPDFADRRETWDGCPAGTTTYEGRECPVSPLRTIAQSGRTGGEVVFLTEPPRVVGCNRYRPQLDEAVTTRWIRPDEGHRDCFSDFAVAVSLDRAGRVLAVDLMLSGP